MYFFNKRCDLINIWQTAFGGQNPSNSLMGFPLWTVTSKVAFGTIAGVELHSWS